MSLPAAEIEYQEQHASDNRQPDIIVAVTICLTAAVLSVGLRLVARRILRTPLQLDDWLILVALIITIAYSSCALLSLRFGFGKHYILATNPISFVKNSLAAELLYVAAILSVKLSILALYRRIFQDSRFRPWLYATGLIVIAYSIASFFTFLLQCVPLDKGWDPTVKGTCLDLGLAFTVTGAVNIFTDVLILSLPLPSLLKLNMQTSGKIQVICMFLLGGLVTIISIIRVTYLNKVSDLDPTWTYVNSQIWTGAEICTAVVSACLPTYRPLFRRATQQVSSAKNQFNSRGYANMETGHSHSDTVWVNAKDEGDTIPLGGIRRQVEISTTSGVA